jgi:hypothetical protein
LVAGVVGAIAMAMVAMTAAATYQGTGFFTPLYHIGSAFAWGESAQAMSESMDQAMGGDLYYYTAGPAALGVGIHLVTGAAWGLLFGLLVRGMRVNRSAVVPVGIVFGIVAMLIMSFAVLPAVAETFDSGAAIRDMPSMVGWGTFSAEHWVFGLVLGLGGLPIASRNTTADTRVSVGSSR